MVKVLGRPVHQKYSLEEGISGFGNPWNIAAHEEVDGEFNDGGEFSAWKDSAGVVEEEPLVHAHVVVEEVAEPWDILNFVHVGEGYVTEIWVQFSEVFIERGVGWKYSDCYLYEIYVRANWVFYESWQNCREHVLQKLSKMEFQGSHQDLQDSHYLLNIRIFVVFHFLRWTKDLLDEGPMFSEKLDNQMDFFLEERTVLESFEGLNEGVHVFLPFWFFWFILELDKEEAQSWFQKLVYQSLVIADQGEHSSNDVWPLGVSLKKTMKFFKDVNSHMFVLLACFLKSFLYCFEEKRLIELINGSAHDSIVKFVTFD